jgi:sigma-E factor negative regulatory protein RseC
MATTCHEEATVTGTAPGGQLQVTVERGEACHACQARGACQALGGQTKDIVLLVDNELDAGPGDRVRITMAESAVIKASLVLYLFPALGLVAGAAGGWFLARAREWQGDLPAILGALTGLIVGFALAKVVGGRMARNKAFTPRMTSITGRAED